MDDMMNHMPHLEDVAAQDVACIRQKEETYRGSWRRGGGVNAWHMASRKIDRLKVMLAPLSAEEIDGMRGYAAASGNIHNGTSREMVSLPLDAYVGMQKLLARAADAEDIFRAMESDCSGADGTVLAEVRDLRRYLLLFEARLLALYPPLRTVIPKPAPVSLGGAQAIVDDVERRVPRFDAVMDEKPCDSYHGVMAGGNCTNCGWAQVSHPYLPRPVPVEDSSRHAAQVNEDPERVTAAEATTLGQTVSLWSYNNLPVRLRACYILNKTSAVLDRSLLVGTEKYETLARYITVITQTQWQGLPAWLQEIYNSVTREDGIMYEMKTEFVTHWGIR